MSQQATVSKTDVAIAFSRAAKTYDGAAVLQRQVGCRLLDCIPAQTYYNAVDVGCGTGYSTHLLLDNLDVESVVGFDIAEGMTRYAYSHSRSPALGFCCGDAEQLPFRSQSIALLFSNLALQWCPNLSAVLNQAYRVLVPGGSCVFSTLGPGTLFELQTAWEAVDQHVHVNHFTDAAFVMLQAETAGFRVRIHQQTEVMTYNHLSELLCELKALGVNNINSGRPTGLTGRQRLQTLKQAYENFRNSDALLPATYQVYYVVLEKVS